jgi:pimeloyl-ACP methyl ester carboxylesterase
MDKGRPVIKTSIPPGLAKALGLGANASATEVAEGVKKSAKTVAGIVSVAVSIAVAGAVIAVVKKMNDGDVAPAISEISAGELHGTMLNVRNRDPVVLIVPGSGPTDRNGNNPSGLSTDAYKLLAEALAREGIASVRVDKHGMFGSAGAGDPNAVTPATYVADYRAWIDAIKAERGPGSGCIFLLGHSEGALMVSLAAEGRKDVCGLILIAGMGRKMSDVIRAQMQANPANAPLLPDAFRALDELQAGRHVDVSALHPALQQLFAPAVQDYLISVLNLDPVEAVRRANKQTLIVQGTTDLQVTVADARLLNAAPKTRMRLIEGMNHVLKKAPIDREANLATYSDPALPLAPRLVRRIEDFIKDKD